MIKRDRTGDLRIFLCGMLALVTIIVAGVVFDNFSGLIGVFILFTGISTALLMMDRPEKKGRPGRGGS